MSKSYCTSVLTSAPSVDLNRRISLTTYCNNGDSEQMLVLALADGSFLVIESSASHGYATASSAKVVTDLRPVFKAIKMWIRNAHSNRDPKVELTGSPEFTQRLSLLQNFGSNVASAA